ncbi:hypothetical protein L0657_06120 [Dyadobacter sp. CY345]|uniref:hypothetical protein n=1 Tax=Dyadobacter sp. CY345 TaxID=2909335 RepID=UPI001F376D20|nr:hypothetical protein [Dyadobacter sp. CY345]MCF2443527.1 hypothetical protein [Dyadobacter sp. CY345]
MKLSLLRSTLFSCLILFPVIFFGCIGSPDCQAPPPKIALQIMDGTLTYPADLDSAARIKVSYLENNQQKYVEDLDIEGDVFFSSMLIQDSRRLNDTEFSLELNGKVLTKIKLETFINNGKCNGWANVSKVTQNGQDVSRLANGTYLIK